MPRTKSPDYARLDDIDVYIQSIPRSPEEEKRLHDLLRKEMEKSRAQQTPSRLSEPTPRKQPRTKTPDYARLDDVDIYVQSVPMTPEEEKRLSAIIKANREKNARVGRRLRPDTPPIVKTPKRNKAANR